ncbi:MAG: hypothetical protein ACE5JZ_00225 [Kiloniellales bacterium]
MPIDSSTSQVVVYLGYHKTASKWVWNNFFKRHYPCRQVNLFERPAAELRKTIGGTGSPFILRQRIEGGLMGGELPALVETIAEAFPDARVVAGIRSQRSMLPSHYGQYVTNGGRLGFAAYLDQVVKTKWHYTPVLKAFLERFGDNMFVYLFEELREDPFALLCRLRDFVGAPEGGLDDQALRRVAAVPPMNPQRNDLVVDTMLLLNRLRMRHPKNAIFPELRRPGHDHILVEVAEVIARSYAARYGRPLRYRRFDDRGALGPAYGAENQELSALLDRPLRDYGYPS